MAVWEAICAMNTLDLLYRIYRARYSLDVLQKRLDKPTRLAFWGSPADSGRMLGWLGELHPRAQNNPVVCLQDAPEDWEGYTACVVHLGQEMPSLELFKEKMRQIPDRIPTMWVVEGRELSLPEATVGVLPRVIQLDPLDPGPRFRKQLPRILPGQALQLARDYSSLRYQYAREITRRASARNARMALASTLAAPPIPGLRTVWRFFATTGETIAMTASQIHLCLLMAALHYRSLDFFDRMGELWPVIGGSFGWRRVARWMVRQLPGIGWLSKGSLAYATTWSVGELSRLYYEYGEPQSEELQRQLKRQVMDELAEQLKDGQPTEEDDDTV